MNLQSNYGSLGTVSLPKFQNRQMRMFQFNPQKPVMPEGFDDYRDVIYDLCEQANVCSTEAHMTVDEKIIESGWSQRRPGAHVDGCWVPELQRWGHYTVDGNPITRMSIIVASSVPGCIVYKGEFTGCPKEDGDLEHIRNQFGESELLPANQGFLLSPDCIHESMRYKEDTQRTFLRIVFDAHEK